MKRARVLIWTLRKCRWGGGEVRRLLQDESVGVGLGDTICDYQRVSNFSAIKKKKPLADKLFFFWHNVSV